MDRYCPRCSALVEDPAADHCLICQLDFASDPPVATSPEMDREREEGIAMEQGSWASRRAARRRGRSSQ